MRIEHTAAQVLLPSDHTPGLHATSDDLREIAGARNLHNHNHHQHDVHNMGVDGKDSSAYHGIHHLHSAEPEDVAATNRDICPMRIGSKVDGFERKGQAWFVATELQSDLVVEVGEMSFHLHKFPLLSRSGKLNRLVFDTRDTESSHIKLNDMPGGPETFELAAKFCYGVAVDLTAGNVAALRCTAEYLEMTEDLDEGNLISKTEAYLSFVVLASWKDSITVLQNCEKLLPWSEQLQVVRRCCESIAWKACTDSRGTRWSIAERPSLEQKRPPNHASPIWNGTKSHHHHQHDHQQKQQLQHNSMLSGHTPGDWWVEDVCCVCVEFFSKVIHAIKVKGMRCDLIGTAVVHYAIKWLPGLTRELVVMGVASEDKDNHAGALVPVDENFHVSRGGYSALPMAAAAAVKEHHHDVHGHGRTSTDLGEILARNRDMIEILCGIIPAPKDAVPCTFLLRLLRLAKMVSVNQTVIADLEKRAGIQLDQGTLSDLLIPSFDRSSQTLYDVDLVQRMLDCFLLQNFVSSSPGGTVAHAAGATVDSPEEKFAVALSHSATIDKIQAAPHALFPAKMRVAKLIDNYLVEVGRDRNLSLNKFLSLAEALPEHTRVTDDGLYKAIDTYLKAHPTLSEHERKKLCRTLDCQRLSLDACMHAAQNERLPLRVVVQVLFGEQIKLRNAVTGTSTTDNLSKSQKGHTEAAHPTTTAAGGTGAAGAGVAAVAAEDDLISIGPGSSLESIRSLDRGDHHHHHHHAVEHDPEHSEEEIKVLRSDVERMKGKFMALEHDYTAIQLQLEKLTKHNPKSHHHSGGGGWKKLIPHAHLPHPHFHMPHFLSHPLDMFHHHGHHHHGHHSGSHHSHHGNSHHHGHGHHSENAKDHHENGHADSSKSSSSAHHDHHRHHHRGKEHGTSNHGGGGGAEGGHHSKDNHHDSQHKDHHRKDYHHHQQAAEDKHLSHEHRQGGGGGSHHESHPHKDYYDQHHKDRQDAHHETDFYGPHHHRHHHPPAHESKDQDDLLLDHVNRGRHHLIETDSSYNLTLSKDCTHFRHSEDHELPRKDNSQSHSITTQVSKRTSAAGLPPPHPHAQHAQPHSHMQQDGGGAAAGAVPPRRSKDGGASHSSGGSHADSGEDSSRSLEGPATPTHHAEQHKKHHPGPFAIAIRKWRNSIS